MLLTKYCRFSEILAQTLPNILCTKHYFTSSAVLRTHFTVFSLLYNLSLGKNASMLLDLSWKGKKMLRCCMICLWNGKTFSLLYHLSVKKKTLSSPYDLSLEKKIVIVAVRYVQNCKIPHYHILYSWHPTPHSTTFK